MSHIVHLLHWLCISSSLRQCDNTAAPSHLLSPKVWNIKALSLSNFGKECTLIKARALETVSNPFSLILCWLLCSLWNKSSTQKFVIVMIVVNILLVVLFFMQIKVKNKFCNCNYCQSKLLMYLFNVINNYVNSYACSNL